MSARNNSYFGIGPPLIADKLQEVPNIWVEGRAIVCNDPGATRQCGKHEWPHHPSSLDLNVITADMNCTALH